MRELRLAGKKVIIEECPILFRYKPDVDWETYFERKSGNWYYENGAIIGEEFTNKGGILFTKEAFDKDVIFIFKGSTVLPATRDLNAVWASHWDTKTDYLGESYVCGLNGWWEYKAGIERNGGNGLFALSRNYKYTPGTEVEMVCGSINGHCFMAVDGELLCEVMDPNPISGGHVGISAYCTKLRITEFEVREALYEKFIQHYDPEF